MNSLKTHSPPVEVSVGPIIGKVTHNSARVLFEFNREDDVTCILKSDQGDKHTCTLRSRANVPVLFKFDGLKPKTLYRVSLGSTSPIGFGIHSSFWTLRENNDNPGELNVAIVSCNEISQQFPKPKEIDLWTNLGKRVDNHELDYIFHIGDQCYMDMGENEATGTEPYQKCIAVLKSTPKDMWEHIREDIMEILRDEYRKTWRHPSVRYVLANVPNLTICDDHEFRDDWGFRPEDITPGTPDYFYGQAARQAYYEYQRQLRDDIDWNKLEALKCEYYDHIFHGVGVSFMEYRGCRSWFREGELDETHMGKDQEAWVKDLYKKGGKFDNVSATLFISPLPVFFISHFFSRIAYYREDDIREHWTYNSVPQLVKLLDLLREWKERCAGREIIVVGGDVHLGGATDIYYKDKRIFKQFISSAINGKVAGPIEKAILTLAQKMGKLNEDYYFKHYGWIRENNYGMIQVRNTDGVASIKTGLVRLKPGKSEE